MASSSIATSISGFKLPWAGTLFTLSPSYSMLNRLVPNRLKPASRKSWASMCSKPVKASSWPSCTTLMRWLPSTGGSDAGGTRAQLPVAAEASASGSQGRGGTTGE